MKSTNVFETAAFLIKSVWPRYNFCQYVILVYQIKLNRILIKLLFIFILIVILNYPVKHFNRKVFKLFFFNACKNLVSFWIIQVHYYKLNYLSAWPLSWLINLKCK